MDGAKIELEGPVFLKYKPNGVAQGHSRAIENEMEKFGGARFRTVTNRNVTRRSQRAQSLPLNAHFWSKRP